MKDNFSTDLQTARHAAQAGARVIRRRYGHPQDSWIKTDSQTIVTETDIAAEDAIIKILRKNSSYRILSEESGLSGSGEGPVWVVDPLDGTSNFARSLPLFAVSLALVHNNDVLAGVVIDPVHEMEYYALKGAGAFCNGKSLCKVQPLNSVPALILNHGSTLEDKARYAELTRCLAIKYNIRKLGTTALELCFVAAGLFDGFICSGDEIWDFAAGVLIASEAGCIFTDWKGKQWDGTGNYIMVTRPDLHSKLISEISALH